MCYQTKILRQKEEIQLRFNLDVSSLKNVESIEFCNAFDFPKTPIITNTQPTTHANYFEKGR